MLTFLPLEEINKMDSWEGSQLNEAKTILAYELTSLVHGEEEARKAKEAAQSFFSGAALSTNAPTFTLCEEDFSDGEIDILSLLVKSELVASRSEARRAVEQGGVSVNDEKVIDIKSAFTADAFKTDFILKRGKKNFKKFNEELINEIKSKITSPAFSYKRNNDIKIIVLFIMK